MQRDEKNIKEYIGKLEKYDGELMLRKEELTREISQKCTHLCLFVCFAYLPVTDPDPGFMHAASDLTALETETREVKQVIAIQEWNVADMEEMQQKVI